MAALIGIVRAQAHTIRRATPQRTAESRCAAPTPTIAPVIVCVVLTGTPSREAISTVIPPAVSAQNPPKGRSFVILVPIVFTILHPPSAVPQAMAVYAPISTHRGMWSALGTYRKPSQPL